MTRKPLTAFLLLCASWVLPCCSGPGSRLDTIEPGDPAVRPGVPPAVQQNEKPLVAPAEAPPASAQPGRQDPVAALEVPLRPGPGPASAHQDDLDARLFLAVLDGSADVIRNLISVGANVNRQNEDGLTPLFGTAMWGHPEAARTLLAAGANPIARAYDGVQPIHAAAAAGHAEMLKVLVEAGAPVDARTSDGGTALALASAKGQLAAVRVLLELGADPNGGDTLGRTPLMYAAVAPPDVGEWLLAHGADPAPKDRHAYTALDYAKAARNGKLANALRDAMGLPRFESPQSVLEGLPALHRAAALDDVDTLRRFLAGGDAPDTTTSDGDTPLHAAAAFNGPHAAAFLISAGAKVDAREPDGDTPLHIAACNGYTDVMKVLLDAGAGPMLKNNRGQTPLVLAAEGCQVEAAKALLAAGARPLRPEDAPFETTALHMAGERGPEELIALLLQAGASPELRDSKGRTPLHAAALYHNGRAVELLVSAGAKHDLFTAAALGKADLLEGFLSEDPQAVNRPILGSTPLRLAVGSGNLEAVRVLLERAAELNAQDEHGETALHSATFGGDKEMVRFLLVAGSDPNAQNDRGTTPLHWAVSNGHGDTVKLLLERGADPNLRDHHGKTPADWARDHGASEILRIIRDHGGREGSELPGQE